jgi:hypothetical protein
MTNTGKKINSNDDVLTRSKPKFPKSQKSIASIFNNFLES